MSWNIELKYQTQSQNWWDAELQNRSSFILGPGCNRDMVWNFPGIVKQVYSISYSYLLLVEVINQITLPR